MSTNYTALTSAIIETAENDDEEFLVQIPSFVMRAQYRIHRDLDTYGIVAYTTIQAAPGNPFLVKPSAALVPKHLYRLSGTSRAPMIMRPDEFLDEYWPDRTSTGTPKYYANWGFAQYLIAPAPSVTTTFEFSHVAAPTPLNAATSTNWLTNYAPEPLFYASMVEANMFMKHWAAGAVWDARYKDSISSLRNEARRNRRDDNNVNQNPAGADNTLDGGD